ncbi:hypothetical protein G6L37_05765 [Agrobacterium rubi]|nr:hypothetical protein [Agrobacterium rubi]NTF24866.1 hypothetical protein [Agrobacterium rubi]
MQKALISLLGQVYVAPSGAEATSRIEAAALNAEAALEGYTFSPDLLDAVSSLDTLSFRRFRDHILTDLRALSGSLMNHAALYNRFPYDTPEAQSYLAKRIVSAFRNELGLPHNNHVLLSCGHFICDDLFPDLTEFSACPLCQNQVRELSDSDQVRYDFKSVTPLKLLGLATDETVAAAVTRLIARPSSLSSDEREFANAAIRQGFRATVPSEVFRENLPLAFAAAGEDVDSIRHLVKGAGDVLRLATWMSDADADLSLATSVKFSISKARRRKLLILLDSMKNLEEDILRHREKWKRLAYDIHVGRAEVRRRHPRVAAAFDKLRSDPAELPSFSRTTEHMVRERAAVALAKHLSSRPGEFLRRFDYMVRTYRGSDIGADFCDMLTGVVKDAALPALFALRKHLAGRTRKSAFRVFVPKGATNKMKIAEDRRKVVLPETVERATSVIEDEIVRRLRELPPLGKVFVDPALHDQVVPFNRRGDSSTTIPVTKGQRYPMGDAPVIRLFVHWTGEDVDLSTVVYDDQFNVLQNVYYGDLHHNGWNVIHSGDVTYAPEGASEFIDFDPAHIAAKGGRYLMGHLISYRGGPFKGFPCFAGFMERDALRSGAKYEPESVALKFDVKSGTTSHMPLIFDVVKREVIFADIASGGRSHTNVHGRQSDLQIAARAVVELPRVKPTLGDVAHLHAVARGELVTSRAEADCVFDWDSLHGMDVMSIETMSSFNV